MTRQRDRTQGNEKKGKRTRGGTLARKYNAERQGVEQGGQGRETRDRKED